MSYSTPAMTEELSIEQHRQLAKDLFNGVWRLLDRAERSADDDLEMIHMAHASRHHWGVAGQPVHWARGEWQCARVYAVVGRAEPALYHGGRCLALCEANAIGDFDLAFAHEALARGLKVAGDREACARHLELARAAGARIADDGDRRHFEAELATIGSGGGGA